MKDDLVEIAGRVRALLDERGVTQADLARVLSLDESCGLHLRRTSYFVHKFSHAGRTS